MLYFVAYLTIEYQQMQESTQVAATLAPATEPTLRRSGC
jgi:hypothetical protein